MRYNLLSHSNYSFNKVLLSGRKILTSKGFWENIKTDFHNIIQKDIISGAYCVFFIFTKIKKLLLLDSAHSMLKADQKKGKCNMLQDDDVTSTEVGISFPLKP